MGANLQLRQPTKKTEKEKKRDGQMHGCTHLSRFALVSRVFPGRNAKKYTGYCIIACVPMWKRYRVLIELHNVVHHLFKRYSIQAGLEAQMVRQSYDFLSAFNCKENLEKLLTSKLGGVILLTTKLGKEMLL